MTESTNISGPFTSASERDILHYRMETLRFAKRLMESDDFDHQGKTLVELASELFTFVQNGSLPDRSEEKPAEKKVVDETAQPFPVYDVGSLIAMPLSRGDVPDVPTFFEAYIALSKAHRALQELYVATLGDGPNP